MPEQTQVGEMPAEQQTETTPAVTVEALQAELDRVQKALKEANKEAASRRKRLEELETADKTRKDSELSEMEKLQAQLKEYQEKATRLERSQLQRDIAERVGLPAVFAARIQGATPEEMEADAKALADALPKPPEPKPAPPKSPGILPANPGANGSTAETDAQKRERLMGQRVNIFDDDFARSHGGGVVVKPED